MYLCITLLIKRFGKLWISGIGIQKQIKFDVSLKTAPVFNRPSVARAVL